MNRVRFQGRKKEENAGGELAARDTAYRVRWLCLALVLLALHSSSMKAP
jgi:hypothetical protein